MPGKSAIEWTQATWNPVTGCTKVSPGCAHCYAETFAERWRGIPGHAYEQGFDLKLWPERLEVPLRWRKPRMVFVNSMSDLFHEQVPLEYIADVFAVMAACPQHTFQVLTKRPERMHAMLVLETFRRLVDGSVAHECALPGDFPRLLDVEWPLPNVWLGVTIENRRFVDRADLLRDTPAAVRFISAEPLLGPLVHDTFSPVYGSTWSDRYRPPHRSYDGPPLNLKGIDWLICGGESGPGCRRFDLAWARALRDACASTGTAYFLKQLGGHPDKRGGDKALLDGRRHTAMPETAVLA